MYDVQYVYFTINYADTFYAYRHCNVIEAKKMVLDSRNTTTYEILDGVRNQVIGAMNSGATLLLRMADSAGKYQSYVYI